MYDYDIDNDPGNTYLGLSAKQWRGIFKFCGGIFVFIFTLAIIIYVYFGSTEHISVVYIENDKPVLFTTEKEFLSFALDTSLIARGLDLYNFTSPKFIKMLKHLEPAYFRIGGTEQDRLHFNPYKVPLNLQEYEVQQDGDHCAYDEAMCIIRVASRPNFTMTGSDWLLINNIARKANLKLIFGLNSLIRKPDGSWDSKNAQKLILFSKKNRFNVNWELGNEPNAFYHQFFYSVNATQMAKDFAKLKNILNGYKMYKKSLLLGPDVTRPRKNHQESMKYLNEFLENKDSHVVDAITWHQYYLDGHNANPNEFLDTEILDLLSEEIDTIKKIREDSGVEHKQIWLGETSSAYGGGASGMSDKYIALFMWADKLGISAKKGISVVIRQSIFEGHYALLDDDFDPNPDWWFSVLYKQLVSPVVVQSKIVTDSNIRLYTHCTLPGGNYNKGSLTVFGMNIGHLDQKIRIEGINDNENTVYVYELSTNFIFSQYILLNDYVLNLTDGFNLPAFKPNILKLRPFLTIKPFTVVFFVVPNAEVQACSDL